MFVWPNKNFQPLLQISAQQIATIDHPTTIIQTYRNCTLRTYSWQKNSIINYIILSNTPNMTLFASTEQQKL